MLLNDNNGGLLLCKCWGLGSSVSTCSFNWGFSSLSMDWSSSNLLGSSSWSSGSGWFFFSSSGFFYILLHFLSEGLY
jgi:hypothetical protein